MIACNASSTITHPFRRCFWCWMLLLSVMMNGVHAWVAVNKGGLATSGRLSSRPSTTRLAMIGNLFPGGGTTSSSDSQSLPRDVKEAVQSCRQAVQAALQKQCSRMDITFPVGTKFGVEAQPKKNKKKKAMQDDEDGSTLVTKELLDQSDRELARLFVEMFQPVGGENLCVAFTDYNQAEAAKKRWKGDASASSRILSMDRRKAPGSSKTKKKKKARGFAAKMAAEVGDGGDTAAVGGPFELPPNTEVALFAAPGPKELVVIERICEQVGMGTLVILLNSRLDSIDNFGSAAAEELFTNEFESVFCLTAASQDSAPSCLLHRAYPNQWILARKPSVGPPKTILVQDSKPTPEECGTALDAQPRSDVEKGVETALENVANWFR